MTKGRKQTTEPIFETVILRKKKPVITGGILNRGLLQ